MSRSVEERLATLERSARRWRLACGGMLVLAVAAVGVGAANKAKPDVKEMDELKVNELMVKALLVMNEKGVPVVIVGQDKQGAGTIGVSSPDGERSVSIRANDKTAIVSVSEGGKTFWRTPQAQAEKEK